MAARAAAWEIEHGTGLNILMDFEELLQSAALRHQIAQPPACHGIGLGYGIDGDDIVRELARAYMLSLDR